MKQTVCGQNAVANVETLEPRLLLSGATQLLQPVGPLTDLSAGGVYDAFRAAVDRSSDLSGYTEQELDAARRWVVGLPDAGAVDVLLAGLGVAASEPVDLLPDTYVWQFPEDTSGRDVAERLADLPNVAFYYPLVANKVAIRDADIRFVPNDELFGDQWHLHNEGQTGGTPGEDINIEPVWDNYLGTGIVVGIVDDGIDYNHPDLIGHYRPDLSYDYQDDDPDPLPENGDTHGTAVAGVALANGNNSIGVSGVAPEADLAAIRLLGGPTTDEMEAAALRHLDQDIHVYNNSWGPADGIYLLVGPGPLTQAALREGVTTGRGGLGNIYVWAAGNGLAFNDNTNYDGYANSRYTIAVSAVDDDGVQAYYSEPGAPILVAAPSSGVGVGITTTDLPGPPGLDPGDYTGSFGGTSSTAPVLSGVVALMLEANPNLSWRDVQHILVQTARKNDPTDPDWTVNGAGLEVNHKYGFGVVDAYAAVTAAETWQPVGPEFSLTTGEMLVNQAIPDNDLAGGLTATVDVGQDITIESVEVVFDADHQRRGDLQVVLVSPDGTESVLAEPHSDTRQDINHWTFTSVHHWGESSLGQWTLKVADGADGKVGTWNSWTLNFYGTLPEAGEISDRALDWLADQQNGDGSWPDAQGAPSVGQTATAALAMLSSGAGATHPAAAAALNWLAARQRPDGAVTTGSAPNFDTAMAILALRATGEAAYNPAIEAAAGYLLDAQVREDGASNGGWALAAGDDATLPGTAFALLALHYAEQVNPADTLIPAEALRAAERFITRCQNLQATNPHFSTADDGGFLLRPAGRWEQAESSSAMTAAGLWGLQAAGVDAEDPRVRAAEAWLDENFRIDQNVPLGETLLYYGLYGLAQGSTVAGRTTVADRDWYGDLVALLAARQQADGHFAGTEPTWESDLAATTWAALALQTQILPDDAAVEIAVVGPAELTVYAPDGQVVGPAGVQNVLLSAPEAGQYAIELLGTGQGEYELTIDGLVGPALHTTAVFDGAIAAGEAWGSRLVVSGIAGPVTLDATAPNIAPEIVSVALAPAEIDEGQAVTVTGSFTDPEATDRHLLVIDWADGTVQAVDLPAGAREFAVEHTYADDLPATAIDLREVGVTVSDGLDSETEVVEVTTRNVAPALTEVELNPREIREGQAVQLEVAFADPGADTHQLAVDWGDGRGELISLPAGRRGARLWHRYADDLPGGTAADEMEVVVTVLDDDGGIDQAAVPIAVRNAPPRVEVEAAGPAEENDLAVVRLRLEDPGMRPADWQAPRVSTLAAVKAMVDGKLPSEVFTGQIAAADLLDDDGDQHWLATSGAVPGGGGDQYGIVATGTLDVRADGLYSFALSGDDGGMLRIGGQIVLYDFGAHDFQDRYAQVQLAAGQYPIEWVAFEQAGTAGWEVSVAVGDNSSAVSAENGWAVLAEASALEEIGLAGPMDVTAYYLRGGGTETFTLEIDWGDGQAETLDLGAGYRQFDLTHRYLDNAGDDGYRVSVRVTDDDGAAAEDHAHVMVRNVAPNISGPVSQVAYYNDFDAPATVAEGIGAALSPVPEDGRLLAQPWPEGGRGGVIHDGGKGMFSIHQADGGTVSFSLALPGESPEAGPTGALLMNHLNGASPKADVDTGEAGTPNAVPLTDPTDWQEFWVVLGASGGAQFALVFANGMVPLFTTLTAGDGQDIPGISYLAMGVDGAGAIDVDFFSYALGTVVPMGYIPGEGFIDPPGGWTYTYDGAAAAAEPGRALDGQWSHRNGSDDWDGSAPGEGNPGGAGVFTEDGTTFLRIQDTGDPGDYGYPDGPGSNRGIYFTRNIQGLDGAGTNVLDAGVTLHFRARIATPDPDGAPLDAYLPDRPEGPAAQRLVDVEQFDALGNANGTFAGRMLQNDSTGNPAARTTLTLTDLPAHESIDLNFLLAIIDSWDGSMWFCGGDRFNVEVDGRVVFSESFARIRLLQSYRPAPGALLTPFPVSDLGFEAPADSAYDMGLEPAFDGIPHSADMLTISFYASGSGWEGGRNESWGIDNVQVVLNGVPAEHVGLDSDVVYEGDTVALTGRFTDPGTLDTHTVRVDWGDGTSETIELDAGQRAFQAEHAYADVGRHVEDYGIYVTVVDDDHGRDCTLTVVTVLPTDPAEPEDITEEMRIRAGRLRYKRRLEQFRLTVWIRNTSEQSYSGALKLVLTGLPDDVSLLEADGTTDEGLPYIDLSPFVGEDGSFDPGDVLKVKLRFAADSPEPFEVGYRVIAG